MRKREQLRAARAAGKRAGLAAASWVFDGNTEREVYAYVLRLLDDGDPAIYDAYQLPSLSGEFADEYGMSDLAEECGLTAAMHGHGTDADAQALDDCAEEWEQASSSAFWNEVERVARYHTAPCDLPGASR